MRSEIKRTVFNGTRVPGPIRTAILGFGVSGRVFHAPFIENNKKFSLDFIVTGNPDRARQAKETYPQANVVASHEELFEEHSGSIDLVVLGTPPSTHFPLATTAIHNGMHVVVDKPFVPTSAEAAKLIAEAEQAGTALTVFQNRRWDADFLTLRKLVNTRALGDVFSFESRFEWWQPNGQRDWKGTANLAEGGGILYDLGSHLIDQALQLFGPVTEVYGHAVRHSNDLSDADDDAFVYLVHENGTRSHLRMNGIAALPAPRFHVLGSAGAYTKWGLDTQEGELDRGMLPSDPGYGIEPQAAWGTLSNGNETKPEPAERGAYQEFYSRLAASLTAGDPLPVDATDSLNVLRIIERVHSGTRQKYELPTFRTTTESH